MPELLLRLLALGNITDSGDVNRAFVPGKKPPENFNREYSAISTAMITQGHPYCTLRCFCGDIPGIFFLRGQISIFHREEGIPRIPVHFACCSICFQDVAGFIINEEDCFAAKFEQLGIFSAALPFGLFHLLHFGHVLVDGDNFAGRELIDIILTPA